MFSKLDILLACLVCEGLSKDVARCVALKVCVGDYAQF